MEELKLNTIEEAIADFREGKFVIVVDDEDRENEGDLIVAAEKITPEQVNFMLNLLAGIIVPIGLFFYFRIWRFSIRLDKDLKNIIKTNREIQERINNKSFII